MDPIIQHLRIGGGGRPISPRKNNNIAPLRYTKQLRLVRLDLDSPRMAEAIINLGYAKDDLDTKKTREDFPSEDSRITELRF